MRSLALKTLKVVGLVVTLLVLLHLLHFDTPLGFLLCLCVALGAVTLFEGEEEPRRIKLRARTDLWAEKLQVK